MRHPGKPREISLSPDRNWSAWCHKCHLHRVGEPPPYPDVCHHLEAETNRSGVRPVGYQDSNGQPLTFDPGLGRPPITGGGGHQFPGSRKVEIHGLVRQAVSAEAGQPASQLATRAQGFDGVPARARDPARQADRHPGQVRKGVAQAAPRPVPASSSWTATSTKPSSEWSAMGCPYPKRAGNPWGTSRLPLPTRCIARSKRRDPRRPSSRGRRSNYSAKERSRGGIGQR